MSEPARAAPALPARWRLLTILTVSYGAGAFGMLGISPLSPSLVEGLGLTRFQVAFLVPSIYLSGLLFSLPGGRLADRLGVRPSFLGGLAVAAIGLLAAAVANAVEDALAHLGVVVRSLPITPEQVWRWIK